MRILFYLLCMFVISGCSGKLYTIVNPSLPENGAEKKIQGILVYQAVNVIELYKTTTLIDTKSGNLLGSAATGACVPDKKINLTTITDYSKPSIVVYEPGLFETNAFGVKLDKGVLAAVNTESSPSAALPDIASVLPFITAPKTDSSLAAATGKPLCNASPELIGIFEAPQPRPFSQMAQ